MENVNKQLLERWAAFGKAMQKAGSELPRHLIAETEQAIAAAEQAQQDEPAHPCWSCSKPVTMGRRAAADGNCPHCGAELDLDDWPQAQQQAVPDVIEQIAQQWDECMYDSADGCHIDIGQAILQAGQRLAAAQKGGR